ncbi:MAG: M24 family metallopeptidase [Coxiellaceae bacterium]|nr:M24 family metallopeptidase [Coxiellaceae bacterium]
MSNSLTMKESLSKLNEYTEQQDAERVQQANEQSWEILEVICDAIKPGVKESEMVAYCFEVYKKFNVDRIWHQPLVRFGKNTVLTCLDRADDDLTLQQDDIAFVDIGVVIDGIEGDVGKTLVLGDNAEYQALADYTKTLFMQAKEYWQSQPVTGVELYDFVRAEAEKQGYDCPLNHPGHLIGSFAHAASRWTKGLSRYPEVVRSNHWVLEIQIKHKQQPFGGFYEQLLYPRAN